MNLGEWMHPTHWVQPEDDALLHLGATEGIAGIFGSLVATTPPGQGRGD